MDIYQHSWIQEESLCYEHKKNDGQQIQNVQNFQQLRNNATVRPERSVEGAESKGLA